MDLSEFKNARVLVIGDVMLDRYWWGTVSRISPEAPVPVVRLERETLKPGGAANVAVNAATLSARVSIIGLAGSDTDANSLREAIREAGLMNEHIVSSESRKTIVKTRVLAHGQQIVRIDLEQTLELSNSEAERIFDLATECMTETDIVILSDYGKGLLTEHLTQELIRSARTLNLPVLADPKGKHFDKYNGATLLTPNRREAAEACKIDEGDGELVVKAGAQLLNDIQIENVLITESENGMTLFRKGYPSRHFDAAAEEVFDVTGAGDTVIASFGVALAAGFPMAEAAWLSNVAAGVSVQHIGTTAVSLDELERVVAARSESPVGLDTPHEL